jgi:prepilin-type N-terminal cleavage/methylation domain-containing protein
MNLYMDESMSRKGMSLLEVLIVVAIIAVLIGLLLPAIQKIRGAAVKTQSRNNVRQIVLATHNFASARGRLPSLDSEPPGRFMGDSLFESLLPHLEQDSIYRAQKTDPAFRAACPLFRSPADPSLLGNEDFAQTCSYPANAFAFQNLSTLEGSFPDGTSGTIAFAERFSRCATSGVAFNLTMPSVGFRRASFADGGPACGGLNQGDVYPVTTGATTQPSVPGVTFQTNPLPWVEKCDPTLPQTPHADGMIVALVDGSLRTVSPSIHPTVFWAAVTPAGGEINSDW